MHACTCRSPWLSRKFDLALRVRKMEEFDNAVTRILTERKILDRIVKKNKKKYWPSKKII